VFSNPFGEVEGTPVPTGAPDVPSVIPVMKGTRAFPTILYRPVDHRRLQVESTLHVRVMVLTPISPELLSAFKSTNGDRHRNGSVTVQNTYTFQVSFRAPVENNELSW
jgi:hypothetical protein